LAGRWRRRRPATIPDASSRPALIAAARQPAAAAPSGTRTPEGPATWRACAAAASAGAAVARRTGRQAARWVGDADGAIADLPLVHPNPCSRGLGRPDGCGSVQCAPSCSPTSARCLGGQPPPPPHQPLWSTTALISTRRRMRRGALAAAGARWTGSWLPARGGGFAGRPPRRAASPSWGARERCSGGHQAMVVLLPALDLLRLSFHPLPLLLLWFDLFALVFFLDAARR